VALVEIVGCLVHTYRDRKDSVSLLPFRAPLGEDFFKGFSEGGKPLVK
jgi:hypothetical protein